jgi:hypothetical protein
VREQGVSEREVSESMGARAGGTPNCFAGACALIVSVGFDISKSGRPDATASFPGLEGVSACREESTRVRQMQVVPNCS